MTYVFTNDYKNEFRRYIDDLFNDKVSTREQRIDATQALTDAYIEHTGERPDPVQLDRLATLILREELTDDNPWKMKQNEYPIMSDEQYARRKFGVHRTTEGGKSYEVNLSAALSKGTDGRDYSKGKRRKLTTEEMLQQDKTAKIRNEERQQRYKEFIKPSKVVTYRLGDAIGD